MTDAQHMQVTGYLTADTTMTPLRGRHRHKRSFAISGDFDFVKQPAALPSLPNNKLDPSDVQIDRTGGSREPPEIVVEQKIVPPEAAAASSPSPRLENPNATSPRFFISEEPRFSSPFRGVPDAIINLDDALKTKPKCFKSHKRSESAPADLAVLLNAKTVSHSSQMIEEEDDDGDETEEDHNSQINFGVPDVAEGGNKSTLLSPLRPMSPSPAAHLQELTLDGSPVRWNRDSRADNYNSLKINRQKQRYYQYTKKLPIANAGIQPQTLREKESSTSLSSACLKTPLSSFQTPSRQASTPSTPLSAGFSNNNDQFENNSGLTSPFRSRQMHSSMRNAANSSFGYEPKVYEMPHGRANSDSVSSRDDKTLYKNEMSLTDGCDVTDDDNNGSENDGEKANMLSISKELLFGQPGDTVDLSSISSSVKETFTNYKSSSNEVLSPVRLDTNDDSEPLSSANDTPESRSVSDTLLVVQKTRKEKRKVKSKLNVLFMNIFRYTNNYERGANEKKA
ncbi:hypothetical protein HG536_0B00310 [Torulaspora globosa]|uniref:Uncharacterized protein n=1 Tax=Torulaspora globosa TaxID=48254 RepID=A0A7G3ZCD4_9SACH|nr:uncharacterized protein HG536_0B00310 [Torulaspora globosa]QLL31170.1 hypothetical protein HG536_0B00310 [Torulaspora globosa]